MYLQTVAMAMTSTLAVRILFWEITCGGTRWAGGFRPAVFCYLGLGLSKPGAGRPSPGTGPHAGPGATPPHAGTVWRGSTHGGGVVCPGTRLPSACGGVEKGRGGWWWAGLMPRPAAAWPAWCLARHEAAASGRQGAARAHVTCQTRARDLCPVALGEAWRDDRPASTRPQVFGWLRQTLPHAQGRRAAGPLGHRSTEAQKPRSAEAQKPRSTAPPSLPSHRATRAQGPGTASRASPEAPAQCPRAVPLGQARHRTGPTRCLAFRRDPSGLAHRPAFIRIHPPSSASARAPTPLLKAAALFPAPHRLPLALPPPNPVSRCFPCPSSSWPVLHHEVHHPRGHRGPVPGRQRLRVRGHLPLRRLWYVLPLGVLAIASP